MNVFERCNVHRSGVKGSCWDYAGYPDSVGVSKSLYDFSGTHPLLSSFVLPKLALSSNIRTVSMLGWRGRSVRTADGCIDALGGTFQEFHLDGIATFPSAFVIRSNIDLNHSTSLGARHYRLQLPCSDMLCFLDGSPLACVYALLP